MKKFWVVVWCRGPRRGVPRPACARSHGRLRELERAAVLAGRAAARVVVSGELASVLRLAAALVGGAAALSVSEDFNDIFDLGT